jgi:hypothetical protein
MKPNDENKKNIKRIIDKVEKLNDDDFVLDPFFERRAKEIEENIFAITNEENMVIVRNNGRTLEWLAEKDWYNQGDGNGSWGDWDMYTEKCPVILEEDKSERSIGAMAIDVIEDLNGCTTKDINDILKIVGANLGLSFIITKT